MLQFAELQRTSASMSLTEPSRATIELRVQEVQRLFDALDPFPTPSRDLASTVETFVLDWARELPRNAEIDIIIHMPESEARTSEAAAVPAAFAAHFSKSAACLTRDLHELLRIGRASLLVGLAVLGVCVIASRALSLSFGDGPFIGVFSEGLIILGWVANWRPIEIFLYDWWPLVRRRRLHRRLAAASVSIRVD